MVLTNITEELYAVLDRVLPKGFGIKTGIDYNLTLAAQRIGSLDAMRDSKVDRYLNMSVQDDMNSLLISSEGTRIGQFLDVIQRHGFTGWISRYWSIGDLDHSTLFLTRASWDTGLSPDETYEDYIRHVFGEECLPEMREALRLLEENGTFQGDVLFAVGFPYPNLMRGHFEMTRQFAGASKPREDLLRGRDNYVRIRRLVRSALDKTRHAGRSRLEYLVGRLATCALFLETAYTVERAGFAYRAGQARGARERRALRGRRSAQRGGGPAQGGRRAGPADHRGPHRDRAGRVGRGAARCDERVYVQISQGQGIHRTQRID